jgi:hypothetical protein
LGDWGVVRWSSRYADPEAEGVIPVFRTRGKVSHLRTWSNSVLLDIHILRSSSGPLVLVGLEDWREGAADSAEANTGGALPPGGPLILLRSVIALLSFKEQPKRESRGGV